MSYALLTSLYFGEGSNADLTDAPTRSRLHIHTPLEEFIPKMIQRGLDVILTGNPGDGKSHVVRTLEDRGALGGALVVPDLSAQPTAEVSRAWLHARERGKAFVLCGNQGPLSDLIETLSVEPRLGEAMRELQAQLRHLVVQRTEQLPPMPQAAMLIDLADRSVLDPAIIERALERVCREEFLPPLGHLATTTSAGRNLLLFLSDQRVGRRFARLLAVAGRRAGEHVTFRQLWGCVAFALTAGKSPMKLRAEMSSDRVGLGTSPLDNLASELGQGPLIDAVRRFADPGAVTIPELDEEIWTQGHPASGKWLLDDPPEESPARLWASGDKKAALEQHAALKRLVALAHEGGEPLIEAVEQRTELPSQIEDRLLLKRAIAGVRGLFLAPTEGRRAPSWLVDGLPLFVSLSYREAPVEDRPHIAVSVVGEEHFRVLRPQRAPWLRDVLGAPAEEAWLEHKPSGVVLKLDPDFLALIDQATRSSGPLQIPERAHRFLARVAGAEEAADGEQLGDERVAVLAKPRGALDVTIGVRRQQDGGAHYVQAD